MKHTLYLIRHGNTTGTESGLIYGATDLPVTEKGLRQIADLAETGIYPDPEGAALYTSGMLRTEQTFETIYGDAGHTALPLLREMDLGIYEMRKVAELLEDDFGRAWLVGELEDAQLEGGDSVSGFADRISRGIHEVLDAARESGAEASILVVHGGTIVYTMGEFFPDVHDNVWEWTPPPGMGYAVTIDEDGAEWEKIGEYIGRAVPSTAVLED